MMRIYGFFAQRTERMPWWCYMWGGYFGGFLWFGLVALIWIVLGSVCPTDCDAWIAQTWGIP